MEVSFERTKATEHTERSLSLADLIKSIDFDPRPMDQVPICNSAIVLLPAGDAIQ